MRWQRPFHHFGSIAPNQFLYNQFLYQTADESGDGFDDFRPGPHYSRTILYDADGNVFKELQPPADGTAITATLSVAEWLQLAGIPSIDEPNDGAVNSCSADADRPLWAPDRVPAFRLTGVELDIHIITTNEVLGISTMGATQPVTEVRVKMNYVASICHTLYIIYHALYITHR
eukprot:SAG31_NODE_104_length_25069_cov_12.917144_10_plen_174_part_00